MTVQEKVIELMKDVPDTKTLPQWVQGRMPVHYKRLSCSMDEAKRLAKIGAVESLSYFETTPFFTQSLLMGAVISGDYDTIVCVTPSQYGKSWICGQIPILLANQGRKVRIAGGDESTTEIIMNNVLNHLQTVNEEVRAKLIDYKDQIDKLQSSVTKKRLTFKGGGLIEQITLGASVNDPLKYNKAIGRGGAYIIDECALIPDEVLVETGRREFSNVDGTKDLMFMISNPHREGSFYSRLTQEDVPEGTLIVWMDVRTALEEERIPSKQRVLESDFFKRKETCQRYFLCELEEYEDDSMFQNFKLRDFNPDTIFDDLAREQCTFFLGIDSAYRGKDNIDVCLTALSRKGNVYVLDIATIEKTGWQDGKTSEYVTQKILDIVKQFRVRQICVDIGFGVYIVEELAKRQELYGYQVQGINFGGGVSKDRRKDNHYSAKWGANMRAEMHLDLKELMDMGILYYTTGTKTRLEKQMSLVKMYHKSGGNIQIIPKNRIRQQLGKSPDELDSLLLSIHAIMVYNIGSGVLLQDIYDS